MAFKQTYTSYTNIYIYKLNSLIKIYKTTTFTEIDKTFL